MFNVTKSLYLQLIKLFILLLTQMCVDGGGEASEGVFFRFKCVSIAHDNR